MKGPCHECAPKPWRHTPIITGDYDLDATIMHRSNKDMTGRLQQHIYLHQSAYHYETGYNAYRNREG